MTIVATADGRNAAWAADSTSFGRRMLSKMGWTEGKGLGKDQQGTANHLRAIRRSDENLGVGADTDLHGSTGFDATRCNFHSVLRNLRSEHGPGSSGSDDGSSNGKKRGKNGKRKKKSSEEKKDAKKKKLTLAQNKVTAGHAAKMRNAKDLSTKSHEDMAAIFGLKVSEYRSSTVTTVSTGGSGGGGRADIVAEHGRGLVIGKTTRTTSSMEESVVVKSVSLATTGQGSKSDDEEMPVGKGGSRGKRKRRREEDGVDVDGKEDCAKRKKKDKKKRKRNKK